MRLTPLLALLLASCASGHASGGRPHVVAGAYPFAWLAEKVGGPDVTVTDLVKPGVEPHDVELSPRQVGEVKEATLVVHLEGFQPAVDDAVEGAHGYDLSSVVDQLSEGDARTRDPHVWLDPVLMQRMAEGIAGRLASADPAHAAGYRARAAALGRTLFALDASIRTTLSGCASQDVVTSHAAFAYFAARYHLVQRGISGLSPDADPSPKRLAEVAGFARTHHVTTIFFESLVSPKLARTVASEVGARTAVLDPIESVRGSDDYLVVMRRNADTLRTALRCSG
ncbi:MAG TPA: metal ABC transporter substrate-binding protein [Mycobacteriales bacterium]|nr:metal ABC transporter substrate-binding protein [Mycobacteriales bacterium]